MNHSLGPQRKGGGGGGGGLQRRSRSFLSGLLEAGGRWRGAQGIPDRLQPRGERWFGAPPSPPAEGRPPDLFNEAPGLLRAAPEIPREVQSELSSAHSEQNQSFSFRSSAPPPPQLFLSRRTSIELKVD